MRAATYTRVSTDHQAVENQLMRLKEAAEFNGWEIVANFSDKGISGSKGREQRPGLDAALKAAERHSYDVLMVWSLDRLGRSTLDLLRTANLLRKHKRALYLDRERIDTTTDTGEAFFTILAALGQLERKQIVARVNAGLKRAKAEGIKLGRPTVDPAKAERARKLLRKGQSLRTVAAEVGLSRGSIHTIKREMAASA